MHENPRRAVYDYGRDATKSSVAVAFADNGEAPILPLVLSLLTSNPGVLTPGSRLDWQRTEVRGPRIHLRVGNAP